MQSRILKRIYGAAWLALAAACASAARAAPDEGLAVQPAVRQDGARPADARSAASEAKSAAPAAAADTLGFGPAADLGKLDHARGGTDTHNDTSLSGIVTNNSAVNVVTGNNVIDAGSFANMSGIPVVIQNTGANVLIQNSTVVNLQMK
jgi:hypothetical protein